MQALSEPPRLRLAASYLFCATQSVEVDWVLHLIGWEAIDRHERALGEAAGRPRVKVTSIEEMLAIAASEQP